MERQEHLSPEVARLKKEIATLRDRVTQLLAELERLRQRNINVWGEP